MSVEPQHLPVECLRYIAAPMVDQSDLPFRLLCRKYGATLTYTQMLLAEDLLRNETYREKHLLDLRLGCTTPLGRPVVVQLAGNDPNTMVDAGKLVQNYCDAIDVNLGCPQWKAKVGHFGGYLIQSKKDWETVENIIEALVSKLAVPIHVKLRLCSPAESTPVLALKLARLGVSVVVLHARHISHRRRRKGAADLHWVSELVNCFREEGLDTRVVSNGNVRSQEDIHANLKMTAAHGAMVGETLLLNPRLFSNSESRGSVNVISEYLQLCHLYHQTVDVKVVKQHLKNILAHSDFDGFRHTATFAAVWHDILSCASISTIQTILQNQRFV